MTADDVIAIHDWKVCTDAVAEGHAQRIEIELETGVRALLYVWEDERLARRASLAHEVAGVELFAVPERLESGLGWLVVAKPPGTPALQRYPDGISSDEVSPHRARTIVDSLGMCVRKLHQIPGDSACGDLLDEDGDEQSRWLTFSGWVAHELEWFNEGLRQRSLPDDVVARLSKSIGDLRHELSAFHPRNPTCICHGQLGLEHLWLDSSGREVVGLTGFERAALLPREGDIAYLLWFEGVGADEKLTRAFYDGYGAARTMDVQRRERFYRRLVAFQALFGAKGDVPVSEERLIELTSARAL